MGRKKDVLLRIPVLRKEASFWTSFSDKGRNFGTEIDNLAEKYIPDSDLLRLEEEKRDG